MEENTLTTQSTTKTSPTPTLSGFMRKISSLIVLISALILLSCHTTRKAEKQVKSAMKHHPEVLAKFCKDTFPCTISKIDTVTNVEYDFVEIQCPGYEDYLIDTIWLNNSKTQIIDGPTVIVRQNKTNTITKLVKDSAAIRSCELELIKLDKENDNWIEDNLKLSNKVTAKNRWIIWLIIALLCSILCNVLQLKK